MLIITLIKITNYWISSVSYYLTVLCLKCFLIIAFLPTACHFWNEAAVQVSRYVRQLHCPDLLDATFTFPSHRRWFERPFRWGFKGSRHKSRKRQAACSLETVPSRTQTTFKERSRLLRELTRLLLSGSQPGTRGNSREDMQRVFYRCGWLWPNVLRKRLQIWKQRRSVQV